MKKKKLLLWSLLAVVLASQGCATLVQIGEEHWFSDHRLLKEPDNDPDYQNNQEYSHPNSSLKDISNHLAATQGHSRK